MTTNTNTQQIVRASDDDGFGSEYRITNGITESRATLNGEPLGDWTLAPELNNTRTLGRAFFAPTDLDHLVRILSVNLGTYGNWTSVKIEETEAAA